MTLAQLRYAINLQQYGSFKKASEKLSITQPALSLQIQKLENELGVGIFDRSSNPITPTEEGISFLIQAAEIITQVDNLHKSTINLKNNLDGTLTLGVIPTLAPFLIPLFTKQLQEDFPKFKLDIHEMITEDVIKEVRGGFLDAGLISTPVSLLGIQATPIFYERFYFYSSIESKRSIKLENIDYDSLWLLNEGNCFRDQINNFCDLNKIQERRTFNYRSNSIDALIRIVDTKGGFTILPELTTLTLDHLQEENIAPIATKAREIGIITQRANLKEHFVNRLVDYIKKNVPNHMLVPKNLEIVDPGINIQ